MKILIDAMGIRYGTGGETATFNLIQALLRIDSSNHYIIITTEKISWLDLQGENYSQKIIKIKNRFLRRIYVQIVFPIVFNNIDLYHFSKNLGAFAGLHPSIITVYDVSMLKIPDIMPRTDFLYWKVFQGISLRSADRIIAISQAAANDIQKFYRIPRSKIEVVYPGISAKFFPQSKEVIMNARVKYGLPERYILHVGRLDPLKNIPVLIKAFNILRTRENYLGKLVLVGRVEEKKPDKQVGLLINELNLQNDIILLGYVLEEDMPAIYSGASVKVFPSLNEGFGFAALEAMACGTPVIANDIEALREVISYGGVLIKDIDESRLANAIIEIFRNKEYREALVNMGIERSRLFNPVESAKKTINVYEKFAK